MLYRVTIYCCFTGRIYRINVPQLVKGKRIKPRTKMVVPVRIRLLDDSRSRKAEVGYTLDATDCGVKLAGLKSELKVDDQIEIQYRHERASFRVVWVRKLQNSSDYQVGAQSIDRDKNIWGIDFPRKTDEYEKNI
jgi:hypothetical protein